MKNRKLLLIVSLVLALTMSLGSTLAYLQDTDADVNTMVLGNVKITQNEQERDANGELVGFNQDKPALPAVYANGTATGESWAEKGVEFNGVEYKVFDDSMKNVIDKMVTVTNDGNSDAYVRTLIAIEAPEFDPNDLIHINHNGTDCDMSAPVCVTINGVDYVVFAFTYKAALAPKATTAPSLLQLFLDPVTTNEDVAKFGPTWEVLALSQAIQADGFSDPMTALNAGFGAVTAEKVNEWFGGWETWQKDGKIDTPNAEWPSNAPRPIPAANAAELTALLEDGIPAGATVALAEGVDYGTATITGELKNVTIQGADGMNARFIIEAGAVLENVTLTDLELDRDDSSSGFAYAGAIVINKGATVKNLVIEDTEITGEGSRSSAVNINEPTAQVTLRNVTTNGQLYAVYGYGAWDALTLEDCTFQNHSSWVVQTSGTDSIGWNLTINNCTFENCGGGIAKQTNSGNHADASVVFTNNTLTNCASHADKGHVWFQKLGNTGNNTVSGNTLDGVAWDVDIVTGLTK